MLSSIVYHKQGRKESKGAEEGICKKNQSAFADWFFRSALFLEAGAAASAVDGDFSFAPGNPQILAAVGAFEVAVIFVFTYGALKAEPLKYRTCLNHKFCVFLSPFGQIPGQQPKETPDNNDLARPVKQTVSGEGMEQEEQQGETEQAEV